MEKENGIITYSPYIIWYDKTTGQKIRLHLFNHEYSNMNIPYINENLFALLLCKTKYTYLLNVWEVQYQWMGPVVTQHLFYM